MSQEPDIGNMPIGPAGILALDPSKTSTGWAYADAEAVDGWPEIAIGKGVGPHKGVVYGARSFKDDSYDWWTLRFPRWLAGVLDRYRPVAVYAEEPIFRPQRDSKRRCEIMFGGKALIVATCMHRQITPQWVEPTEIKKHFSGSGMSGKPDMLAIARGRGWAPQNDNVADALGVLDLAVARERAGMRLARRQARIDSAIAAGR